MLILKLGDCSRDQMDIFKDMLTETGTGAYYTLV